MISKKNQDLIDFLFQRFGLIVKVVPEFSTYVANVTWNLDFPADFDIVCEKTLRIFDHEGKTEDEAIKKMIHDLSGKTLYKIKNKRWKKKAVLPEFSSLAELKLKLMILSGEKEEEA